MSFKISLLSINNLNINSHRGNRLTLKKNVPCPVDICEQEEPSKVLEFYNKFRGLGLIPSLIVPAEVVPVEELKQVIPTENDFVDNKEGLVEEQEMKEVVFPETPTLIEDPVEEVVVEPVKESVVEPVVEPAKEVAQEQAEQPKRNRRRQKLEL